MTTLIAHRAAWFAAGLVTMASVVEITRGEYGPAALYAAGAAIVMLGNRKAPA